MKEVDQQTGKDFPSSDLLPPTAIAPPSSSMDRGVDVAALKHKQPPLSTSRRSRLLLRTTKQLTADKLFETQQLIQSGVLPVEQHPTLDASEGFAATSPSRRPWPNSRTPTEVAYSHVSETLKRAQGGAG